MSDFPNYDAAAAALGGGPVGFLSAKYAVDDALGDEPLFSRRLACDDRAWQCRQGSHDDYRCYEYTQVWPKEAER